MEHKTNNIALATSEEKEHVQPDVADVEMKPTDSVCQNDIDKKAGEQLNPLEALGYPDIEAKQRQLVRRLDITFMPLLWILYFHNYLDRNNIA